MSLDGCDAEDPVDAENDLRLILLDNTSLQGIFSDRCRVKRIVGDIWWRGVWGNPSQDPPQAAVDEYVIDSWQCFIGLRKDETSNALPFGLKYSPMLNDEDFSEAEWIKTWQKANVGRQIKNESFTDFSNFTFPIWRNDTHTTGAPKNILADGSGIIEVVTTGESDCIPCENTGVQTDAIGITLGTVHHFHIDHRRSISLRENEQLMLQLGFLFPFLTAAAGSRDPTLEFFGGIKILVEV
jgi:hypothetical protein